MKKRRHTVYTLTKQSSCLTIALWLLSVSVGLSQTLRMDSLKANLTKPLPYSTRFRVLRKMAQAYLSYSPDSSMLMAQQALRIAQKYDYTVGRGQALELISLVHIMRGELPEALENGFATLKIAQSIHSPFGVPNTLTNIGVIYSELGGYRQAIHYYNQGLNEYAQIKNAPFFDSLSTDTRRSLTKEIKQKMASVMSNIAHAYIRLAKLDSARLINEQAYQMANQSALSVPAQVFINMGLLRVAVAEPQQAFQSFRQALSLTNAQYDKDSRADIYLQLATLFDNTHQSDSSLYYANLALQNSQPGFRAEKLKAISLLAKLYRAQSNRDSTIRYLEMAKAINDSLYRPEKFQQIQLLILTEQQHQQDLLTQQQVYRERIRLYGLLTGLSIVLLIAFGLWISNRQKQKANALLNRQKEEIDRQRNKAEQALSELKSTQTQLIQKEKLASLGELTAGIAHEIQNPLNFVNNFSELSTELIEELKEEAQAGHIDDVLAIAEDLDSNIQKIHHHGGRASSIVKGMLEHSRTESGEKRPTDLNALADEYLKIAYHGQRAKETSGSPDRFNCELITDFDPTLEPVEVAPQEIGRVLLNLYNNAFYAVSEKARHTSDSNYKPTVEVRTKHESDRVVIQVRDNGTGIPDSVKAKIFQPFFTTKPTGEGTGLGLSLSYEIITKGHGGNLSVDSEPNQETVFTIALPLV